MLLVEVARELSRVVRAQVLPALFEAQERKRDPYAARMRAARAQWTPHCHGKPEEGFDRTAEVRPLKITLGKRAVLYTRDWPVGDETGLGEGTGVFKPRGLVTNIPVPGMVIVNLLKVGNMGITVGGNVDAHWWAPERPSMHLDLPTMTYGSTFTLLGTYTGLVPPGCNEGDEFEFKITLKGIEPKRAVKAPSRKVPQAPAAQ